MQQVFAQVCSNGRDGRQCGGVSSLLLVDDAVLIAGSEECLYRMVNEIIVWWKKAEGMHNRIIVPSALYDSDIW